MSFTDLFSIGQSIDPDFINLLSSLPPEILGFNGVRKIDPFVLSDEYFETDSVADLSIDPNANITGKSPVNFNSEIFKPILKLRAMSVAYKSIKEQFGKQIADETLSASMTGKVYHHDWTKYDVPYCFAPDSSFWMLNGRPYGWLPGGAPRKFKSFMGQTVEVAMDMSQEHAGAIGIANVLVNSAWYIHKDRQQLNKAVELLDKEIENIAVKMEIIARMFAHDEESFEKYMDLTRYNKCVFKFANMLYDKDIEDGLQQLVHVLHNTFRIGGDSPFTNLSLFCRETIKTVFKDAKYPDWTSPLDIIDEVMEVQLIFARFFSKGSPLTGKNYRFPVCTVNFKSKSREFFTDEELEKYPDKNLLILDRQFLWDIAKLNAKRGVFNFHRGEKIASCCRLTSDLAELKENIKTDTFGNGGMSIGSHRVVAINLHNVACESIRTGQSFYDLLIKYMQYAEVLLYIHKQWLKKIIRTGTLKFFNLGWEDLNMFFSTFGFTGLWDCYQVLKDANKLNTDYVFFAKNLLNQMEAYAKICNSKYPDYAFNVEEVPAENASPKLAQIDNFMFKDFTWYNRVELLGNQMIPMYVDDYDMFERLEILGDLMDRVSGGAIGHFPVDGSMTEEASVRLIELMFEVYGLVHFAIEIGSTTCVNGHTTVGIHPVCPECDAEIATWTRRVVGFNSDTKDWHSVRRDWENVRRKVYHFE